MTDGNTGFQVAPITEDDMSRVHSILKRAADAIVGMSQLTADVDMLRQTVASLQADADRLRSQNNALDEALNYSRSERDKLASSLNNQALELANATDKANRAQDEADRLDLANGQLEIDLDLTRKAKDDAEFRVLELEDKLASAEAKLAKVAELHRAIFPEPEAKPEPPKAEPTTEPWPPMKADGLSVNEPATPYVETRPDSQDHWDPGYVWDSATLKYWREGVTPRSDGEAIPF